MGKHYDQFDLDDRIDWPHDGPIDFDNRPRVAAKRNYSTHPKGCVPGFDRHQI